MLVAVHPALLGCRAVIDGRKPPYREIHMNRSILTLAPALAAFAGLSLAASLAQATFTSINPNATYFDEASASGSLPVALSLASLGITPGTTINVLQVGGFSFFGTGFNDTITATYAVFSSSSVILPYSGFANTSRLPGAVAAAWPAYVFPNAANDVFEDTNIDSFNFPLGQTVVVPAGAAFMFFSSVDSVYGDNTDPNGDYGVIITIIPTPGAATLLGVGGLMAARRRRN